MWGRVVVSDQFVRIMMTMPGGGSLLCQLDESSADGVSDQIVSCFPNAFGIVACMHMQLRVMTITVVRVSGDGIERISRQRLARTVCGN
jgi:hypothetical protein